MKNLFQNLKNLGEWNLCKLCKTKKGMNPQRYLKIAERVYREG